jgi:hypothetical protein
MQEQNDRRRNIPTPWSEMSFEDKRSIVGGGRAGYEARKRNSWRISR